MEHNKTAQDTLNELSSTGALPAHRKIRLSSTSAFALAAVAAAAILIPARAQAADCADGTNPAGTTCDTDSIKTLDNVVPTYNNLGTMNATQANGVTLDHATAVFTNNGTFNVKAGAGLNFNTAGATFTNNGTFNNSTALGIQINANANFTNNGTFNQTVTNGFDVQSGDVTFANVGTYNVLGGTINLGAGMFTNSGTLNIGSGTGGVADTNLTGDYTQTSTGVLKLRANWGTAAADKLVVSGTADLNGRVAPTFINVTGSTLTQTIVIGSAGTLTMSGISVANSAAVTNSVAASGSDLELTSTINFMGSGTQVTGNAATMARTINAMFTGGANLPFVTGLLNVPSTAEYVRALQSLGPVADSRGATSTLTTSNTFANQMLSCRVPGEGDAYAVIREGQCAWARVTGRSGETGSNDAGPGVNSSSFMVSTGAQFNVGGPWRVGGAIGYEEASSNNAIARSDAQRVHLGGVVKYNPGPWLFAFGLNGGFGNSDNKRFASFGGFTGSASSSNDTDYIAGRFTTAYLMPLGGFYLKPQFDIAQTYISRGGYTESATGGIGLTVAGSNLSVWTYAPSIEMGMQTRLANNSIVRPYAKVGGTWQDKDQVSTTAAFTGIAGSTFTMTSSMDRAFLDLGGGLDVISTDGSVLRLQLDGQYGENTTSHSGSAKFSLKF
jgi:uncharacterized protein with beta-barrel porin domain